MAKKSEPRAARTAALQASADSLGASVPAGATPATQLAEVWKSLAGVGIPAEALAAAQQQYVAEATTIWNRLLVPSGQAPAWRNARRCSV